MFRFIPPAGSQLPPKYIVTSARKLYQRDNADDFVSAFAKRFQVQHVMGLSSGRAALAVILRSLHRLAPDRDVVAVPAYTCFSVPAAVVRANLRLYPVEINPKTLDLEMAQLLEVPSDKLLCVLTANLFGLVGDTSRIRAIARSKGAFVVDDAAQALGASRDGRLAGTQGDVGFFSFARGKGVAGVGGGLIVTDSDAIAEVIRQDLSMVASSSFSENVRLLVVMAAYSALLHPRLYWFPNAMPFLKLGLTEFEAGFSIGHLPPVARALIDMALNDMKSANEGRFETASRVRRALEQSTDFALPEPAPGCRPTYIRLPLIARNESVSRGTLARLHEAGIGASSMYPTAVCDIPGIERHMAPTDFHRAQAEELSLRLLTVPTHPYVREKDIRQMIDILLGKAPGAAIGSQARSTQANRVRLDSVK